MYVYYVYTYPLKFTKARGPSWVHQSFTRPPWEVPPAALELPGAEDVSRQIMGNHSESQNNYYD